MMKSLFIALAVSLFLAACVGTEPAPTAVAEKADERLEGRTWKLVSFGLTRMAVPQKANIIFNDGHYSGHGGCNGVGGDYTSEDDKLTMSAGFSTMMACPELDLEHKYMKYLESVSRFDIEGDTLDLRSDDQILLRFKAQ